MSYFHITNRRVSEVTGVPPFVPDGELGAEWGDIEYEDVLAWDGELHRLYIALYMAGYRPVRTHFRVTETHCVTIHFETRSMTTFADAERKDIEVEFETIFQADLHEGGQSYPCGLFAAGNVPVELGVLESELEDSDHPVFIVEAHGGKVTMNIFGEYSEDHAGYVAIPPLRTEYDYTGAISYCSRFVRYMLIDAVYCRWFKSVDGPPAHDAWADQEEDIVFPAELVVGEGPLGLIGPIPDGLLWLFNPANWTVTHPGQNSDLLISTATTIWENFEKRGFSNSRRTDEEGIERFELNFGHFSAIASRLFRTDRQRAKRFFESLDLVIQENAADIPSELAAILPDLPYLELVMVLANHGILTLPIVGLTAPVLPIWDDEMLEFSYFDFRKANNKPSAGNPFERIEISVLGERVAVLDYEVPLLDYRHGGQSGAELQLKDLVCWELREKEDVPSQGAKESERHHLIIVAAPGVRINAPRHPLPTVFTQLVRVQDQEEVPPLFTPIDLAQFYIGWTEQLLPPGLKPVPQIEENPALALPDGEEWTSADDSGELPAFSVRRIVENGPEAEPDAPPTGDVVGVEIEFPAADVTLPPFSASPGSPRMKLTDLFGIKIRLTLVDPEVPDQRFGYHIYRHRLSSEGREVCWNDDNGALSPMHMFSVVIHKTPGVRIEVEYKNPPIGVIMDEHGGEYFSAEPDFVRWYCYDVIDSKTPKMGPINLIPYDDGPLKYNRAHEYDAGNGQPKKGGLVNREAWLGTLIDWGDGVLPEYFSDGLDTIAFAGEDAGPEGTAFRIPNYRRVDTGKSFYEWRQHKELTLVGPALADYRNVESWSEMLSKLSIDIGVGFIPVVGDAVDVVELGYALTTGKDKWGDPVSGWQLVLMAGCTAVPFVGNGWAKAATKAVP